MNSSNEEPDPERWQNKSQDLANLLALLPDEGIDPFDGVTLAFRSWANEMSNLNTLLDVTPSHANIAHRWDERVSELRAMFTKRFESIYLNSANVSKMPPRWAHKIYKELKQSSKK